MLKKQSKTNLSANESVSKVDALEAFFFGKVWEFGKMGEVLKRISHDKMFLISAGVAALSLFLSRPRVTDIDWKTIFSLTALLVLVAVYEHLEVLSYGAAWLVKLARTKRLLVQILVVAAFVAAMFLTNDAAIIALTPILMLVAAKVQLPVVLPVVLVNVAANLGSMVMPFGNPQNLYLLNHFNLRLADFWQMAWPIATASLGLLWLFSLRISRDQIGDVKLPELKLQWSKLVFALCGTVLILAGIFALIPLWLMLAVAILLLLVIDPQLFKRLDYGLLLTFMMFFIAVGDVGRAPLVHHFMHALGATPFGTYLSGLLSSQVISNVPAVILLAPYTTHVYPLFLGVNLGGLGTLIASLANLLAYKQYYAWAKEPSNSYFKVFLQVNLCCLLVLGLLGAFLIAFQS